MKITVTKDNYNNLTALTSLDFEKIQKLKSDCAYEFDFKKIRNPKFHRKGFALLNLGFANCKLDFPSFDLYRKYATIKAGHYVSVDTGKGLFVDAKSLSFGNMDDTEFKQVYDDILQFIIIDTGATKEDIENNYLNFM